MFFLFKNTPIWDLFLAFNSIPEFLLLFFFFGNKYFGFSRICRRDLMTPEVNTRFQAIAEGSLLLWRPVSTPLMGVPRLWRLIQGGLNPGLGGRSPRCRISERNRVTKRCPRLSRVEHRAEFRSPTPNGGSRATNAGSPPRIARRGFSTRMRLPRLRRASARITSSRGTGIFRITWRTLSRLRPN